MEGQATAGRHRHLSRVGLTAVLLLSALSACGGGQTSLPGTTTPVIAAAPSSGPFPQNPQFPRTQKWIDLDVGQCLGELPQIDLGAVDVTLVDCATPHQAEVYYRAAMWVNTTVADVAEKDCEAAFPGYTGRAVAGSGYAVTYLVDAGQDRTTNSPATAPAPGTAICLLTDANGRPLTASARVSR